LRRTDTFTSNQYILYEITCRKAARTGTSFQAVV